MGRKSRAKRERRSQPKNWAAELEADRNRRLRGAEAEFATRSGAIREILARHAPIDVLVTLGVSELWMPNIAAQVRHHFILGLAVSMEADAYSGARSLDNFVNAAQFLNELYALVPTFPMLEDFVPEPDWGEVRVPLGDAYARVFYGGSVERIADFVEAFRLVHWSNAAARASLDYAIAIQDAVLSRVERTWGGDDESLEAGHMEVPPESFWSVCRAVLLAACSSAPAEHDPAASGLVPRLGELTRPATATDFVNTFMGGRSVRALAVDVEGARIPVGIRNALGMLVDYWTDRTADAPQEARAMLDERIAAFVATRMGGTATITGPCRLASHHHLVPRRFATLINARGALLLVLVVDASELESLASLPAQLRAVLDDPEGWTLRLLAERRIAQLRRSDGSWPQYDDVKLVVVLSSLTTVPTALPIPAGVAHVVSLWDFVTLFDSLEGANQLLKFWDYADALKEKLGPMLGPVDLFASYRDSDGVLIDGAIEPTMVMLDPHWNSRWRFRALSEFWRAAPPRFPNGSHAWNVEPMSDGLQRLTSKGSPTIAWSSTVGGRVVQAVFHVPDPPLDLQNGRLLETFIHCLIDGIAQRADLVEAAGVLLADHIVVTCVAHEDTLATEHDDTETPARLDGSLLCDWTPSDAPPGSQFLSVRVNLARVQARLTAPLDASFEAEAVVEIMRGIARLAGRELAEAHVDALANTGARRPRFVLAKVRRRIDVPDHPDPDLPSPQHFKLARRDLAMAIRDQGVEPGEYQLAQAKAIIDPARDVLREQVHARIMAVDRDSLLAWAISFHDELTARYQHQVFRVRQSLTHEVSFDRSTLLAEEYTKYVDMSRNVRYLLEAALTLPSHLTAVATASDLLPLVATIGWLLVLYGASDVLHNDIEVAGITIGDQFVPRVFYAADRQERQAAFSREAADTTLGIDLREDDEVRSREEDPAHWAGLDLAFVCDLGFSLTQLAGFLTVLSRWTELGDADELAFGYRASAAAIEASAVRSIEGLTEEQAAALVSFATLDAGGIRRLPGRAEDEADVPIWEHAKRVHRYALRPLIAMPDDTLSWGAAAAERSLSVWTGSIANGYLPADLDWPHVVPAVEAIKAGLEQALEGQAFDVVARATPYVLANVNFMRRFPREKFDDVGDFDVLAYWPDANLWLIVECKYNKPPYCLKDAARLRREIFGPRKDPWQFRKIEARRRFLMSRVEQLRQLLGWPEAYFAGPPAFLEAYVSRQIFWWMRNPPYPVPTEFVRIDALDSWMRSRNLLP